jgi:hypothetical protein
MSKIYLVIDDASIGKCHLDFKLTDLGVTLVGLGIVVISELVEAGVDFVVGKRLFENLGHFDKGLVGSGCLEDLELCTRCWRMDYEVKILPETTCYHLSKDAEVKVKPRTPMDHPKYDGSVSNILRVLYLHYPEYLWQNELKRYRQQCSDLGCVWNEKWFQPELLDHRSTELSKVSKHLPDWILDRMQKVG